MTPELQQSLLPSLTKRGLASPNQLLSPVDPRRVLRRDIQRLGGVLSDADVYFAPSGRFGGRTLKCYALPSQSYVGVSRWGWLGPGHTSLHPQQKSGPLCCATRCLGR